MQAYKGKGQEYRLFWPSRPEFIRMAARYGATIVPFAGVGAEDGFNMLLDSQEIRKLPVMGSMLEERSRREVPRARRQAPFMQDLPCYRSDSRQQSQCLMTQEKRHAELGKCCVSFGQPRKSRTIQSQA